MSCPLTWEEESHKAKRSCELAYGAEACLCFQKDFTLASKTSHGAKIHTRQNCGRGKKIRDKGFTEIISMTLSVYIALGWVESHFSTISKFPPFLAFSDTLSMSFLQGNQGEGRENESNSKLALVNSLLILARFWPKMAGMTGLRVWGIVEVGLIRSAFSLVRGKGNFFLSLSSAPSICESV